MLENSLRRERIDLLSLSILVASELRKTGHTNLVITRLSEWITDEDENIALRSAAAPHLPTGDRIITVGRGPRPHRSSCRCASGWSERPQTNQLRSGSGSNAG